MKGNCVWPDSSVYANTHTWTHPRYLSLSLLLCDFSIADLKLRRQPNELACIVRA